MHIGWNDLSREEQETLKTLVRSPFSPLSTEMARRLKELGLAEQKLGGTGASDEGRKLARRMG